MRPSIDKTCADFGLTLGQPGRRIDSLERLHKELAWHGSVQARRVPQHEAAPPIHGARRPLRQRRSPAPSQVHTRKIRPYILDLERHFAEFSGEDRLLDKDELTELWRDIAVKSAGKLSEDDEKLIRAAAEQLMKDRGLGQRVGSVRESSSSGPL